VPYFHVVFTLPAPAAEIAFHNKAAVYAILFRAAAEALRGVAADRRYLGADAAAFADQLDALARIDWVVYAKPPFAGPEQVLGYLGRYTHRVAIANSRLVGLANGQVSFTWKDYRQHGTTRLMTLAADEFIRRFLQHTVPDGFHRIRHIGFLANRHRTAKLALCRSLLAAPPPDDPPPRRWQDRLHELTGQPIDVCPECRGQTLPCGTLQPRPPPRPAMWCDSS
jgi:hypothetical protein